MVSPARCQYLHVYVGNTDTYCSSQVDTASMKSDICIYMHLRAHTFTARMHTCMYVCIRCVPYVVRICTYY